MRAPLRHPAGRRGRIYGNTMTVPMRNTQSQIKDLAALIGFVVVLGLSAAALSLWTGPWIALLSMLVVALALGDGLLARWVNRRVRVRTGAEAMVGRRGIVVRADASAAGWQYRVKIGGELWNADSECMLAPGNPVRVVSMRGLWLRVVPHPT